MSAQILGFSFINNAVQGESKLTPLVFATANVVQLVNVSEEWRIDQERSLAGTAVNVTSVV